MRCRPYPFEHLPRLARAHVGVLRGLHQRLGSARARCLQRWAEHLGLQPVPSLQLGDVWSQAPEALWQRLASVLLVPLVGPGSSRATVGIDYDLAGRLSGHLLGIDHAPLLSAPGLEERGMLLYLVAALLECLDDEGGWSVAASIADAETLLDRCEPDRRQLEGLRARQPAVVEGRMHLLGRLGSVWLIIEPELLHAPAARPMERRERRALIRKLRTEIPIVAARLQLTAAQLEGLETGDLLVSEDLPRSPSAAAVLQIGRHGYPLELCGRECKIAGPYQEEIRPMTQQGDASSDAQASIAESLPLELTVEYGRLSLTGAQVMDLQPGDVLTIEGSPLGRVELRVGGQLLAQGELVDVEGEAGVRILELKA